MKPDQKSIDRGIEVFNKLSPPAYNAMKAGLESISPDLMDFVVGFPFGQLDDRTTLPKRERQLITMASLATRGDASNQLRIHIDIALNIGISVEEIAECFLQLAPYGGFPTAINATMMLREAVAARESAQK